MINLMKWMSKVSERLKATTVTYKDYSTTTGTSLYQGYYFGNIEGVAISGKSLIGVTVVSAQDNTPAFCAMLTNNIIRAYSTVASKTITIRCIYLGGVISYLIHLTESLKSFCGGRRWARYAEPQEIAYTNSRKSGATRRQVEQLSITPDAWNVCLQRDIYRNNSLFGQPGGEGKLRYSMLSGCRGADCAMRFGWVKLHHNSKSFNSGYFCANQLSAVGILTAIPREGVRAC